ncbi:mCG145163, partial [Mus musculus]
SESCSTRRRRVRRGKEAMLASSRSGGRRPSLQLRTGRAERELERTPEMERKQRIVIWELLVGGEVHSVMEETSVEGP